ncbi:hypothetical protein E2542_SST26440 [Spatholobus suberectus]|nr:hypothetical protein E2542_SST26440 [Spatholobus suberectus]
MHHLCLRSRRHPSLSRGFTACQALCQCRPNRVLSPLVFFPISSHFTAPPKIPSAPTVLQLGSFHCLSRVKPWDLTANLKSHHYGTTLTTNG